MPVSKGYQQLKYQVLKNKLFVLKMVCKYTEKLKLIRQSNLFNMESISSH